VRAGVARNAELGVLDVRQTASTPLVDTDVSRVDVRSGDAQDGLDQLVGRVLLEEVA